MWKNHYKNIYMCKDSHLIITAICGFPNIEDTIEKCNLAYKIKEINEDPIYKEIVAYLNLVEFGRNFIPVAFADIIPKLDKLQQIKPIGKSFFGVLVMYLHIW